MVCATRKTASNFGFQSPPSILVLVPEGGCGTGFRTLFSEKRHDEHEKLALRARRASRARVLRTLWQALRACFPRFAGGCGRFAPTCRCRCLQALAVITVPANGRSRRIKTFTNNYSLINLRITWQSGPNPEGCSRTCAGQAKLCLHSSRNIDVPAGFIRVAYTNVGTQSSGIC